MRRIKLLTLSLAAILLMEVFCVSCAPVGRDRTLTVGVYADSYWGTPNGDRYKILDDAIARFEEEHQGIRVE